MVLRQVTDNAREWAATGTAAGGAKLIAALIAYPYEVTKLALGVTVKYSGLVQCIRLIWRHQGIRDIYSGLIPSLLRAILPTSI